MDIVGCIGDLHAPFELPEYLNFCFQVFKKAKVTRVVQIGDLTDNHATSYHEHDPDGLSAGDELQVAKRHLQPWFDTFPKVDVLEGNHGVLPRRKMFTAGLSGLWLKSMKEVLEFPEGWNLHQSLEIDGVLYEHGLGWSGRYAALNKAIYARQSCVIGHLHGYGGCNYQTNKKGSIFGLNVGCGIDSKAYAMAYGKNFKDQPTIGCGIIVNGKKGFFIPMIR